MIAGKSISRKVLETEEIFDELQKNIRNISDLSNLSKTCRYFIRYFENKSIKKFVDYDYDCKIEINIDSFKTVEENYLYSEPEHPIINSPPIISKKDKYNDIDTLVYGKQLSLVVALPGLKFDVTKHDYKQIINNTFLDEIICEIKNAEVNISSPVILNLNHSHGFVNHIISPYIVSRYGNPSIEIIKMNLFCFLQELDQEEIFKEVDIFRGYKNFHELRIYENAALPQKNRTFDEDSLFMHVLRCLSKRKNAILRIEVPQNGNIKLCFLTQTFKSAIELNIEIKFLISIGCKKRGFVNWREKIKILENDISKYITHIKCYIENQTDLLQFMKLLPDLENLSSLKIIFDEFDVRDILKNDSIIECNVISLRRLIKLKKFSIKMEHKCLEIPEYTYREICNFHNYIIRYFISILPSTIIFLELENVLYLTPQICVLMEKFLPNIEFLFAKHVDFTNKKCLVTFKNLKYLQLYNCPLIELPRNIEFLIHKYSLSCKAPYYFGEDYDVMEESKRQKKKYILSFNKEILDITRNFSYYFNKLHKWEFYKSLVERFVVDKVKSN
ncbi:Hypothetical protein SRAE_1000065400 [Strongyloides ratti]|uniref:F-box domain-containing protein n=1 Tax=Strongyloides ratti TaxID=34506 RepID=A0A090KY76_STRRB|nr:Hypothetical protein SRAE_1000065400 [Strongyloides ratti]CEF62381.1 Hypothetical protein SRAE_1000065400 [Strongyloides ratti]